MNMQFGGPQQFSGAGPFEGIGQFQPRKTPIKTRIANIIKDNILTICVFLGIFIISAIFTLIFEIFVPDEKPIYNKDNIEVYYKYYSNNIYVKNDNSNNVNIQIGKSTYSLSNTRGKRVALGLNSNYGSVKIRINDDTVNIYYAEPADVY